MNTKHLESLLVVAECGSITAAAQKLFISSPALQQQLNLLERETGVKLLERSPKGVTPTPAGRVFLVGARRIIADVKRTLEDSRLEIEKSSETIRIGAITGLVPDLYPKISAPFRKIYPHVKQEPVMEEEEQLFRDLDEGKLDVVEYYDGAKAHRPGRQFIPLVWEGRDCLMTGSHPLAGKTEITPEDLKGYTVHPYRFERIPGFKEFMTQHYPEVVLQEGGAVTDYYTLLRCYEDGRIGLVPPHVASQFAPLVAIPLKLDMKWATGIVCRKNAGITVQHYIDVARKVYGIGDK